MCSTQLIDAYGEDAVIRRNAEDGLSICASVLATGTPTPSATPPPVPSSDSLGEIGGSVRNLLICLCLP